MDERVRRAAQGDREAFGELVEEHQAGLYGLLVSIVRDGAAAEDLAQQAFLKAYKALPGFRGQAGFKTWLYRIGVNEARSWLRWRKLRNWLPLTELKEKPPAAPPGFERRLELDRALAKLSGRERETVALRLEGFELKEIAAALGLAEGSVKSYLFWGLRKLRKELA